MLRRRLGDAIRKNDQCARDLWSALVNLEWVRGSTEIIDYTFRDAASLIAEIHGNSLYTRWYCSGPAGVVAEYIGNVLASEGWRLLEDE